MKPISPELRGFVEPNEAVHCGLCPQNLFICTTHQHGTLRGIVIPRAQPGPEGTSAAPSTWQLPGTTLADAPGSPCRRLARNSVPHPSLATSGPLSFKRKRQNLSR